MFPSIWVLKRIGTRKAVLVTALCQALCGAIRILFSLLPVSRGVYFWAIFASQFFGALPNALLAALPAEISAHWFGEHERSVATAIGTLAQLVGIGSETRCWLRSCRVPSHAFAQVDRRLVATTSAALALAAVAAT